MNQSANPLKQFFRQPAIYFRLPSEGSFWPEGSVEIPGTGELPVLPMTAIDEITYRTPDALFNGQAVISVIQSCIPAIKDAWKCPSADLNAILVAIRIASYGSDMDIGSVCPECKTEGDYTLDLRTVLDQQKFGEFNKAISYGDLEVSFRPIDYEEQNKVNQLQFEQQKLLQLIPDSDLPEDEKIKRLRSVVDQITDLTLEALKWSIASIRTPQAIVTNQDHILEFLKNCDRKLFVQIRDHIGQLRTRTDLKPLDIKCSHCNHEYQQPLTLDMASFFGTAS